MLGRMTIDDRLLRIRAVNDANQLVIDHAAFGDAEMIDKLADLVERTNFQNAPVYAEMVAAELRTRATAIRSLPT